MKGFPYVEGVTVIGDAKERYDEALSAPALDFVAGLERRFRARRDDLLHMRAERQHALDRGESLGFLEETREVREGDWSVVAPAEGLVDRRCEITGPTDRRMAINALNSGARVWMADFEDANSPPWDNIVQGQLNLQDVIDRRIDFQHRRGAAATSSPPSTRHVVVRPRGWHLWREARPRRRASRSPAACSTSADPRPPHPHDKAQPPASARTSTCPKIESHLEARLWNDAFDLAQEAWALARGTIRATVLIETIPAAFEMEEILYELRDHAAGLNAGRWDYLFSIIKKFRNRGGRSCCPTATR